jgi:hypothetical protein
MSNKSTLKGFFVTGARPTQAQFEDLIDSSVNLLDANSGNVQLTGGVVVGNVNVPDVQGAIKWDGTSFQFRNTAGFQPLNLAAGITNPLNIGNVRIGSTLTGAIAVFAHGSKYADNDFAFGQSPGGTTLISSGTPNPIVFQNRTGGSPTNVLTIQGGKATANTDLTVNNILTVNTQAIIGTPPGAAPPIPAGTTLAVYGQAQKLVGAAWAVMSDVRVKKDIAPFTEGLNKLLQVKPVKFKYRGFEHIEGGKEEQVGVLAHEIRSTFPYMVQEARQAIITTEGEIKGLLSFDSSALQYVVINAIRELHERIDKLERSLKQENEK